MGVGTCAFNGLYDIICRNPDTAAGGLDPDSTVYHASGFYRHVGDELDDLPGDGLDRKVQIKYEGTGEWHSYANSASSHWMRTFNVVIRIGYFAGSHVDETHATLGDDEQLIGQAIARTANLPVCTNGCVSAYMPQSSNVVKLDDDRLILEISVAVQVIG